MTRKKSRQRAARWLRRATGVSLPLAATVVKVCERAHRIGLSWSDLGDPTTPVGALRAHGLDLNMVYPAPDETGRPSEYACAYYTLTGKKGTAAVPFLG